MGPPGKHELTAKFQGTRKDLGELAEELLSKGAINIQGPAIPREKPDYGEQNKALYDMLELHGVPNSPCTSGAYYIHGQYNITLIADYDNHMFRLGWCTEGNGDEAVKSIEFSELWDLMVYIKVDWTK